MKLTEVGIPPEDAQFLETRRFQAVDIARIFGVPPHKIAELDKATFSNIENQSIEFVQDSMEDWFANWEAEIPHSMLSAREASTVFAQFDRRILLRGDFASRAAGLATLRQNGFINGDEGRDDLGYNPIADGSGQKYVIQLNMQELDKVGETEPDPADKNEPAEPGETK
jgi:HK97 family phage portal protein